MPPTTLATEEVPDSLGYYWQMESFLCGDREASQRFYERNKPVIEVATDTHDLCYQMVKLAQPKLDGQDKTMIWLLGASCLREFEEIVLLVGNGFGTGAIKLMRSFYERVVTMSYLATEDGAKEIQKFIDYSAVHWHQMLVEAEEIHPAFEISPEARQKIVDDYEAAKERFKDEKCPTCKRRGQISWTRVTMKDMATKVGEDVRRVCHNAYLTPTFHLHTTHWGIVNECERSETGKLRFSGGKVQEDAAHEAFDQAYILLMQVMDVLDQYFELGMAEKIKRQGQDWLKASEAVSTLRTPAA
jgi:hypothetical protein